MKHHIAWLALCFWLLGSWSGGHWHFCFDGREPPVSYQMDMDIGATPQGHPVADHRQDVDVDLDTDSVRLTVAKLTAIDLPVALICAVLILVLCLGSAPAPIAPSAPPTRSTRRWRPPSQAPPAIPA